MPTKNLTGTVVWVPNTNFRFCFSGKLAPSWDTRVLDLPAPLFHNASYFSGTPIR